MAGLLDRFRVDGQKQASAFRVMTSALVDRLRWAKQVGMHFQGARDYYEILGYDRTITLHQYREEYRRGGLAKRIVEAFPKATWRGGISIFEDEDPKAETPFEQAFTSLSARLNLWAMFQRADILAGQSSYSVMLLGAPGDLSTELPKGRPEQLVYLRSYIGGGGPARSQRDAMISAATADATIAEYDENITSPRFGEPLTYNLKNTSLATPDFQKPVHWSRVIHIAEGCLEDDVFGIPTLESVWNYLIDYNMKVLGGGAEAFWLRANAGIQLDFDKTMGTPGGAPSPSAEEITALREQADEYKHQISRMMRTRGVNITQLGSDVANFGPSADALVKAIAGSKGIPMRILTGSEMGSLASEQDDSNWQVQIQDRRTSYAGPFIVRRFIDRLIQYGYLPTPTQYEVEWPRVETMSELEKAQGASMWADANQKQGGRLVTDAEIREHWYGRGPLDDKQIAELDAKADEAMERARQQAAVTKPADDEEDDEPKKGTFPRAAGVADDELVTVLEAAIQAGAVEVIDALTGVDRA